MDKIKRTIIDAGVRNLHEFGYPKCNAENIMTDQIYGAFFKSMLEDNLGKDKRADPIIRDILQSLARD